MPRNGSGDYNLPANSWGPLVSGQIAASADGNQTLNDIASALTTSIATDGQSVVTGDISFNGFQLLAAGGIRVAARASAGAPYALYPAGLGANDGIYFGSSGTTYTAFNGSIITTLSSAGFRVVRGQLVVRNGSNAAPGLAPVGGLSAGFVYSPTTFPTYDWVIGASPIMGISVNRPLIHQITNDSGATPLGISGSGVYRISSTKRGKAEITTLAASTALFKTLSPVSFFQKDEHGKTLTGRRFSGFLAEDVHAAKAGLANLGDDGLPLSLDSNGLVAELWAMVQELLTRVETLEAKNAPS